MRAIAGTTLQVLKQEFALPEWTKSSCNAFEVLVNTILSQNTSNRNTTTAFESLSKRYEITPEALATADLKHIQEAIKVAGLYRNKSRAIKQVAALISEKYQGKMQPLLSLPFEEARDLLIQIPGIGPKTADIVLLFSGSNSTIPVDTHINRVAKRLGFAPAKANYNKVQQNLKTLYIPDDYLTVHLLFIQHGRKYCRARRPLCRECPIKDNCPSGRF